MSVRPRHLRAAAIAEILGVSVRTVRRWFAEGTISSVKIGGARLVSLEALERLLEGGSDEED